MKKVRHLLLVFLLLCLLSCSTDFPPNPMTYLICVGFDYEDMAVPTLLGTKNDALETGACLYSLLNFGKSSCSLLTVTSTTMSDCILQIVQQTVNKAYPDDQIIFYFSGHGDIDNQGFFLAAGKTEESPYTKLYISDLIGSLEQGCCMSTVLLDTCHSGACTEFSDSSVFSALEKQSCRKVSIICSCLEEEISMESSASAEDGSYHSHGYFTLLMLKALGWVHSPVEGYGRIEQYPGRITCEDLYLKICKLSGSRFQHPIRNTCVVQSVIIP